MSKDDEVLFPYTGPVESILLGNLSIEDYFSDPGPGELMCLGSTIE